MKIAAKVKKMGDYSDIIIEIGNRNNEYIILKMGELEYLIPIVVWDSISYNYYQIKDI